MCACISEMLMDTGRSGVRARTWRASCGLSTITRRYCPCVCKVNRARWCCYVLQTKNALSVSLDFMEATEFGQAGRREYIAYGLYFGIYLMLFGFHVIFWRMTPCPRKRLVLGLCGLLHLG